MATRRLDAHPVALGNAMPVRIRDRQFNPHLWRGCVELAGAPRLGPGVKLKCGPSGREQQREVLGDWLVRIRVRGALQDRAAAWVVRPVFIGLVRGAGDQVMAVVSGPP
jgi:hypothetical protein